MSEEECARETLREVRKLKVWIKSFTLVLIVVLYLLNYQSSQINSDHAYVVTLHLKMAAAGIDVPLPPSD